MENFTPLSAFSGGILIGLSATLFLLFNGRVSGVSGIMHGLLNTSKTDTFWRLAFLIGLVLGGLVFQFAFPASFSPRQDYPLGLLILGGFLVGFGARMGNGCTSGHAVCGIGNLSIRSIVATLTFMTSGIVTVFVIRHILRLYP